MQKRKRPEDDEPGVIRLKHVKPDTNGPHEVSLPKKASLLGLPAELRNRVYWEALTTDYDKIYVTKLYCKQPGLLSVSRQIRQEATPIFDTGNTFRVSSMNLEFAPQPTHWVWNTTNLDCTSEEVTAFGDCWPNLVEWLRFFHAGSTAFVPGTSDSQLSLIVVALFDVVHAMEAWSWAEVAKVLAPWKYAFNHAFKHALGQA